MAQRAERGSRVALEQQDCSLCMGGERA